VLDKQELKVDGLMLFRDGIKPNWEDPVNSQGGSFILEINMSDKPNHKIDDLWKTVVYSLIGNCF
jgi:translation initiation factor 4E